MSEEPPSGLPNAPDLDAIIQKGLDRAAAREPVPKNNVISDEAIAEAARRLAGPDVAAGDEMNLAGHPTEGETAYREAFDREAATGQKSDVHIQRELARKGLFPYPKPTKQDLRDRTEGAEIADRAKQRTRRPQPRRRSNIGDGDKRVESVYDAYEQ